MRAIRLERTDRGLILHVSQAARRRGVVDVTRAKGASAAVVGRVFSSAGVQPSADDFLTWVLRDERGQPLPNGDFAAVVITEESVFLARDAQGRFPLYYRLDPSGRVAASSTSLSDFADGEELNRSYFCSYLAGSDASQQHIRPTPFMRVERVLPGEVVMLSHDGCIKGRSSVARANGPQLQPEPRQRGRPAALRQALQQAVANRMTRTTGCHLSGGLDSSSVALLAALAIATSLAPRSRDLVLVSATYAEGELEDERCFIDAAVRRVKDILPTAQSLLVPADDLVDFENFKDIAQSSDEPYAQAFRTPLLMRLASSATEAGCESLLTGCGADALVDASSLSLYTLCRQRRWRTAIEEARGWAERQDRSVREVLTDSVLRPAAPLLVDKAARHRVPTSSIRSLGRFARPPWLKREFAEREGYDAAAKQEARFRLGGDPWASTLTSATFIAAPDPLAWWHAEQDGLVWGHPFLDREIADLMRLQPVSADEDEGLPKGILRRALQDLLPEAIRARTRKIPFNSIYARGIQRHAEDLIDACRSARHPLVHEMFDTELLAQAVTQAGLGAGNAMATDRVNSSLALLFWLEGLAAGTGGVAAAPDPGWETHQVAPEANG